MTKSWDQLQESQVEMNELLRSAKSSRKRSGWARTQLPVQAWGKC